jgi:hypothetical protein
MSAVATMDLEVLNLAVPLVDLSLFASRTLGQATLVAVLLGRR